MRLINESGKEGFYWMARIFRLLLIDKDSREEVLKGYEKVALISGISFIL